MSILFFIGVLVALSLLIIAHEWGHFFAARRFKVLVQEFAFGFPPRLFSKQRGETKYSFNALPIGGYVRLFGEHETPLGNESSLAARSFSAQKIWKRATILLAGVFINLILGWLILSVIFLMGTRQGILVATVLPGSPGDVAGFQVQDIIVGYTVADDFIATLGDRPGESREIRVERGGEEYILHVEPRAAVKPGEGRIGVAITEFGFPREPIFTALKDGLKMTGWIIWMIFYTLYELVLSLFGASTVSIGVSGPVGIFNAAYDASNLGFIYVFQLIGVISINLGVLNLLPIPGLDGGRLLFLAIEKIRGVRIHPRREALIHGIGVAVLIILIMVVTFRDVTQLF